MVNVYYASASKSEYIEVIYLQHFSIIVGQELLNIIISSRIY
jgi:hypothetical protein